MPLPGSLNVLGVWQDTAVTNSSDAHWQMIFVGIIAAISVIQLIAVAVGGIMAMRMIKDAKALGARLEQKAQPFITKTQGLVDDLTPKVRAVSENVQQISYTVRAKVDEVGQTVTKINETVRDTNSKTRAQVTRVNGLVSDALTTTHEVSQTVQEGIKAPIRQFAGVIAGLKAGFETLAERSPLLNPKPASVPAPTFTRTSATVETPLIVPIVERIDLP